MHKSLLKEDVELPFGVVMVTYDLPKWKWFVEKLIDEEDLAPQKNLEGRSYHDKPHTTILDGLSPEISIDDVKPLLQHLEKIDVEFLNIDFFEGKYFDVVKFNCESPYLKAQNQIVKTLPHKELYDGYNIHTTIAYVKKGEGQKYVRKITPFTLKPDGYLFSSPDRATVSFII